MKYLIIIFIISMTSCATVKAGVQVLGSGQAASIPAKIIHFATASDKVKGHDKKLVEQNAEWLIENPKTVVVLEGHCDERGSQNYNLELGDRRARSVMSELLKNGVSEKSSITIISHGEDRPVDPAHNEKAWQKNRRVEFVVR